MPNVGDTNACFATLRNLSQQTADPVIEGPATRSHCRRAASPGPYDSGTDRTPTPSTCSTSHASGLVVERTRYAGMDVVERWVMIDYTTDAGLGDARST